MSDNTDERQWDIEELLHRRSDLSTFVIHWTRESEDATPARDNLLNILETRTLEARNPMGAARRPIQDKLQGSVREEALHSQKVVCFTEAPLEQAWSFVCNIKYRNIQLAPFGLAFTKTAARKMGINPVWYTDTTPSGHDWLIKHVWDLVDRAIEAGSAFADEPIAGIAPFVEGMGTWEGSKKEFWWEREWRHLGNRKFALDDVAVVLCPERDMEYFQGHVTSSSGRSVPLIDPRWGLEYIIAQLAHLPPKE